MPEKQNDMDYRRMVIYQIFTRLFGNTNQTNKLNGTIEENGCGKMNDITSEALAAIKKMGVSHVWFTGIIEHAQQTDYSKYGISKDSPDVVKGKAGSPYAIKDYYDIDPDLAEDVPNRMAEFEALIKRTHNAGLKVIIDFVPNHLARYYKSDAAPEGIVDFGINDNNIVNFDKNNNFYYLPDSNFASPAKNDNGECWHESPAKATGNNCFKENPSIYDWYETVKLNYGIDYVTNTPSDFTPEPDTWLKMRDIIMYWTKKGVDGFRCDMAEMVPVEFWQWLTGEVRSKFPDICFIAEIYDSNLYNEYIFKGGFDYLYDKMFFYDMMRNILEGKSPASDITKIWQFTDKLHHFLLYFLENHDEQRIASDFFLGDGWKAIPGMVVAATMFNNPVMFYFGQELGEKGMDNEGFSGLDGRTTIFDYWGLKLMNQWKGNGNYDGEMLDKNSRDLQEFYSCLFNITQENEALYKGRFYDLMWANENNPNFDSEKLYTFLRYTNEQTLLIIANFSGEDVSYKLKLPSHALQSAGLNNDHFFSGADLMKFSKTIQFPGELATNGGFGGKIKKHCASVFELKSFFVQ